MRRDLILGHHESLSLLEKQVVLAYQELSKPALTKVLLTLLRFCYNNTGGFRTKKEDTVATAYCMKCRKKVEIKNPKQITLKNKRPAVEGVCSVCGTKVFRIGKA